ncbi:MAG: DNA-binding domain-containing protein [Mesorhizobium sp.]|nr:DNA-binding domain-containing protein [Mesorhizobium sp.]
MNLAVNSTMSPAQDHATREAAFAAALLDPALPMPAGLTTARGRPDPLRFAVYRNNVAVGLIRALEARFPVVEKLVGADFFKAMARAFIRTEQPATPLIFAYGDGFADFIAGFQPAASVPYLADVARLEALWTRAYHAADRAPLGIAALAAVAPEELALLRLVAHPAAALVRSAFPVGSIWQAHQGDTVATPASVAAETVLVARPDLAVTVTVLPQEDAAFAATLLAGATVGDAAEAALEANPAFDFGPAIVGLFALGAFTALETPDGASDD